jgi:hypothetical protein
MSCSDENVYQGYPIFWGLVLASSIGCVVEIVGLGAVVVTVRFAPWKKQYHLHCLLPQNKDHLDI